MLHFKFWKESPHSRGNSLWRSISKQLQGRLSRITGQHRCGTIPNTILKSCFSTNVEHEGLSQQPACYHREVFFLQNNCMPCCISHSHPPGSRAVHLSPLQLWLPGSQWQQQSSQSSSSLCKRCWSQRGKRSVWARHQHPLRTACNVPEACFEYSLALTQSPWHAGFW